MLLRIVRRSRTIKAMKNVIITKKKAIFEELPRTFKKLISVLATSIPVIDNNGEEVVLK